MPRALLVSALALALSAGISACGGDEDPPALADGPSASQAPAPPAVDGGGVLTGSLPLLDGRDQDLAAYRGKVVLVVNTASECGFAPQFGGLEDLYRERRNEGLVILGFPADDVVGQEPRSNEEIAEFCRANFGVTFPMFAKSNVVDDPVNPLFAKLTESLGEPTYNFNKYLLDRRGRPVERFDQGTEPDDPELTAAIEGEL
jgi:glutathione peroxidase